MSTVRERTGMFVHKPRPRRPRASLDEDSGHWAPDCAGATVRGFECLASTASATSELFPGQQWAAPAW
jgi:hypothetical protein